jgi:hypothetical protein
MPPTVAIPSSLSSSTTTGQTLVPQLSLIAVLVSILMVFIYAGFGASATRQEMDHIFVLFNWFLYFNRVAILLHSL